MNLVLFDDLVSAVFDANRSGVGCRFSEHVATNDVILIGKMACFL